MADYQRVVEFLRDFRTSSVQAVTDELREHATEYARLCTVANERLRQCAGLLQKGLRAEAINLAEASPNLLDLVAALDLPDPEGWAEFCQRSDLPVPPSLQIDRAAALNDAYGQDQPLEQLFARHRRLALSQAPVKARLEVMREIAMADASPFWSKDIAAFEQARFKELRVSFAAAIRDKDAAGVQGLATEVLETPWVEPPPLDLETAANEVQDRVTTAQFTGRLSDALGKLRSAYASRSLGEIAGLLSQIKKLPGEFGQQGLPHAAAAEVQPVIAWVQQEQQLKAREEAFAASCDALNRALNEAAADRELDAAYQQAKGHDQPLPPELEERYAAALRGRARAARWKYALISVAAVAVIAVGLGLWQSSNKSKTEAGWAQKIRQAATDKNLALAKQIIADQEQRAPDASHSPDVSAAKKEVAVLQQKWDEQAHTFRNAAATLEEAARNASTVAADTNATFEKLRDAQLAVEQAIAHRQTVPDVSWVDPKDRLGTVTTQLTALRDELKDRAVRFVLSKAQSVAQRAAVLPTPTGASRAAVDAALKDADAVEKEAAGLRTYAGVTDGVSAALDSVAQHVARVRDGARAVVAELDARAALAANAAGGSAGARAALEDFARRFPHSPLAADFVRAAGNTYVYESVEAWYAASVTWAADPVVATERAALQRLEEVRAYTDAHPASPMLPRAQAYEKYLTGASGALALQNVWQTSMEAVVSVPLISDLKSLETTDGTVYYCLQDPVIRRQRLNDRITYSFDVLDPQNLSRPRAVTVVPPVALKSEKPALMPHAQYVRNLVEQLKTVDRANWETFGPDLVSRIAAEDVKIDVVVKGIILRQALEATNQAVGWAAGAAYEKPLNDLVRQRLDQVVWYDPAHPVPEVTANNLRAIFAAVPAAAEVKKTIAAKKAELSRSLQPVFSGTGLLLRDDAGKWTIESPSGGRRGPQAYALVPAPGWKAPVAPAAPSTQPSSAPGAVPPAEAAAPAPSAPPRFVKVAQTQDNVLVIDDAVARELPQGTLVLFTRQ